jgi:hypothetical protein
MAAACGAQGAGSSSSADAADPAEIAATETASAAHSPSSSGTGSPVAAAKSAAVAGSPAPAAPVAPRFREVVVPEGTRLSLKLSTTVASDSSRVEDAVRATLASPLVIDGTTVVPAGASVVGSVLEANKAGRVKGRASVAVRFDRLQAWDETYSIRTNRIAREAEATKGEDATKVGIGAGAGALIGAVAGGKKGAVVGGAVGAGAGTGVVLATAGDEVRLAEGTTVSTALAEPLKVLVPAN